MFAKDKLGSYGNFDVPGLESRIIPSEKKFLPGLVFHWGVQIGWREVPLAGGKSVRCPVLFLKPGDEEAATSLCEGLLKLKELAESELGEQPEQPQLYEERYPAVLEIMPHSYYVVMGGETVYAHHEND